MKELKPTSLITKNLGEIPEIVVRSTAVLEKLPYPKVHYPNHYATFINFSQIGGSERFFCSCSKTAIDNYLLIHKYIDENNYIKTFGDRDNAFSGHIAKKTKTTKHYDVIFKYKDGLCHKCNCQTPSLRWCHEMYGSVFKQFYGWYIKQKKYELGINGIEVLKDKCPTEVIKLIEGLTSSGTLEIKRDYEDNDSYDYYEQEKVSKALDKYVENLTREEFGFIKIRGQYSDYYNR